MARQTVIVHCNCNYCFRTDEMKLWGEPESVTLLKSDKRRYVDCVFHIGGQIYELFLNFSVFAPNKLLYLTDMYLTVFRLEHKTFSRKWKPKRKSPQEWIRSIWRNRRSPCCARTGRSFISMTRNWRQLTNIAAVSAYTQKPPYIGRPLWKRFCRNWMVAIRLYSDLDPSTHFVRSGWHWFVVSRVLLYLYNIEGWQVNLQLRLRMCMRPIWGRQLPSVLSLNLWFRQMKARKRPCCSHWFPQEELRNWKRWW